MKNLIIIVCCLGLASCTFSYNEETTSSTKTEITRVEKDKDEIALGSINMLLDKQEGPKALVQLKKYFPLPTSNDEALHAYAKAYFYIGDYDSALYSVNEALEIDPDFQGYYTTRGYIHHSRGDEGDLKIAHDNYVQAIQISPSSEQAYINLIELYNQVGDSVGVYTASKTFITNVQTAQSYAKMADAYLLYNDLDSARILCDMSLESDEKYGYAWYKLMVVNFREGNMDKALASYGSYKANTDKEDISYRDGYLIYLELEDFEKAIQEGELAIKYSPNDFEMIAALGNLYKNQNRCEDACRVWQALIDNEIKLAEELKNNLKSCACLEAGV